MSHTQPLALKKSTDEPGFESMEQEIVWVQKVFHYDAITQIHFYTSHMVRAAAKHHSCSKA